MPRTLTTLSLKLASLSLIVMPQAAKAAVCLVSATGVAFGVYTPSQSGPSDSTGTVTVACSAVAEQVQYSIALNAGQNAGGNVLNRRMQGGTTFLSYQLYSNTARTTVWGDGSGGSSTVVDSYFCVLCVSLPRSYNIYGRLPSPQFSVGPGLYGDTITVIVTF